jgi:hypothetical protein
VGQDIDVDLATL